MTNPNPPTSTRNRFRDYLAALLWFLPPTVVLGFASMIMLPVVEELYERAEIAPTAPIVGLMRVQEGLFSYTYPLLAFAIFLLLILEFLWANWKRWRKPVLSMLVWLWNLFVLLTLTLLTTTGLALARSAQ